MFDKFRQLIQKPKTSVSFVQNVVTLMTGTTFAQVLTIIIMPVLTRIYTPGDFGILGVYTSIIGILAVICCGRYELAIVLPEEDKDACNLILVSILWTLITALIILIIVIVGRGWVAFLLKSPRIATWLWLLPINVFCLGLYQTLNYWNTRFKNYKRLAKRQITQSSVTAGVQLSLGFLTKLGAGGLIIGQLVGLIIAISFLIKKFIIEDYVSLKLCFSKQGIIKVAAKYKKYPIYNMLPSILDSLTIALPVMFFTKYFDLDIAGQYSLGVKLLYLPASLIGAAVAQVYFQKIAEEYNKTGDVTKIVKETCKSLLVIAIPFCLIMMLLGPWLFTFFFGSNWRMAGEFCRILAPAIALSFVVSPLSRVFGALDRQEISALWQVIALVATATSLGISLILQNTYYSVLLLMLNNILLYSLYLFLIFRVSGVEVKKLVKVVE